jgi:hypothetical protein
VITWWRFLRLLHAEWRRRGQPPFSDRQPVPGNPSSGTGPPGESSTSRTSWTAPPASGYGGAAQGTGENGAAGPELTGEDREQLDVLAGHLRQMPGAHRNGRQLADQLRGRSADCDAGLGIAMLAITNYAVDIFEACDYNLHPEDSFRVLVDALGAAAVELTALERLDAP